METAREQLSIPIVLRPEDLASEKLDELSGTFTSYSKKTEDVPDILSLIVTFHLKLHRILLVRFSLCTVIVGGFQTRISDRSV